MASRALAIRLHYLRPALVGLLVLDVLALVAFAVRVDTVTRTTTVPAPVVAPAVAPAAPLPVAPALPVAVPAGPAVALEPPTASATTSPTPRPQPTPSAGPKPTTPVDPEPAAARCPIPLRQPTSSGGLQSLIDFAPAFEPFKDEAFAAATAYQPVLQLLGPILAKYPEMAPRLEPFVTPFVNAVGGVLEQGYTLVAPWYAPHRQKVLQAEGRLAAALAPYAQKLLTSPLGGCVVELQATLLEASAGTGTPARAVARR